MCYLCPRTPVTFLQSLYTAEGGVFLSTNNGTNWTPVNSGLMNSETPYLRVQCLLVSGTNLFAGTENPSGVYLSTNNGKSWAGVNSGLNNVFVQCFALSGTNVFAGTEDGQVFLSTNNGTNWVAVDSNLTATDIYSLSVNG